MRLTFDLQNGQFLYSDHRLKKNVVWQKRVKCFPSGPSFLPSSSLGRRKIKSLQSTFPNLILPSFSLSPVSAVSALLTTNKDFDCRYYKPSRRLSWQESTLFAIRGPRPEDHSIQTSGPQLAQGRCTWLVDLNHPDRSAQKLLTTCPKERGFNPLGWWKI